MKKSTAPWIPPSVPAGVTMAIKALAVGNANEGQQKLALNWVINVLCGTYDQSFHPDGDRATTFAEGRRWVGNQIVKEVNIPSTLLRSKQ